MFPSASAEAKGEIPEGREAWSHHCCHTERSLHCTFLIAPRHKDSIKSMATGALQADMTLVMVSVITRPTVQRETIVQVTGDVKAKLSTTHE